MPYTAGAAQVHITPDFRDFHRKIGEQLDHENATFYKAGEKWGKASTAGFTEGWAPKVKVKPDVDTARAKTELDGLSRTRTPAVKPKVDDEKAKLTFRELTRTRVATIKVRVDAAGAKISGAKIGEKLSGLAIPAIGAAGIGLAPSALGAGLLGAGAGLSAATAFAGIGAFAAIAVPEYQKVTKAQQALTAATAQYDKATTKAGRASALKAEAAATAGLTDSEKRLATQLTELKGAWSKVQQAQEPVVGKALTPWLSAATEGMKFLPSVVRPAASAIGALGTEAKTALAAPFWGTFAKTLGSSAETAITGFGDAAGHVADGLAHLFVTLAPDLNKLPGLVNGWARSFDNWAQHYNKSGLDNFLKKTFAPGNIASLKGDLKSLGTTFSNLATATENMSPLAFTGLSNVLSLLAKLSPGQIEALAWLYGGVKAGQAAGSLGQGISGILGVLGGKGGAKGAEGAAGSGILGKLGGAVKYTPNALLALLAADGILNLPGVKTTDKSLAANPKDQAPTVPGIGKLPQSFETPFNMPGPKDPRSANNWLTSWSPYERFFTQTLPGWASTGWHKVSSFMSSPIPGTNNRWLTSWTPYENFFTRTVPGWGRSAAHGLGSAWSASSGWVTSQFGKAKGWVTSKLSGAGSWLTSHGRSAAHGLGNGWNSAKGWVSSEAGAAKGWITSKFGAAGSWLKSHGSAAAHGLGNGWNSASGWVSSVAGRGKGWITGRFSSAGSWLVSHGRSAAHGLGNGYASASGWVSSVASRARGWVTGAFRGAGSWLWGIGESIMSGLASGLSAAVGRVQSILSWVTNHIPSWKGPPAYDRVLLKPAGQMIMSGFTDSLAAGIPGVRSVMGDATRAAQLNVPRISGASLPRVRGGDGGSIPLVISAAGNDQLLQAIVKSLRAEVHGKTQGDVQALLGRGKART